ncbi:fibroblast growth factor 16 isoform X2 [Exaiptasia diaphana]|uniref:Fibroblast growth factor n=1 Tax=Exaiptasia diaphana TaxID=2652724 RepID=A0A913YK82_EXADI|nr:fibroblast growth factor 16 isoform X2 [Exaiptasia diaphana]
MVLFYKISFIQIALLCVSFILVSSISLVQEKRIFLQNYKIKKDIRYGLLSKILTNNAILKRARRSHKVSNAVTPSNSRLVRLQSKASLSSLGVFKNGSVYGGFSINDKHALLKLEVYGTSIVRILALKAKKYIGMNKRGRLCATLKNDTRNLWREVHEQNDFFTYQSLYHFTNNTHRGHFFLAISRSGSPRNGNSTKPGMNSAQFLRIDLDSLGQNKTK